MSPFRFKTEAAYQRWIAVRTLPPATPPFEVRHTLHPFTVAVLAIAALFVAWAFVVLWFTF